jgi:hypothetical protein
MFEIERFLRVGGEGDPSRLPPVMGDGKIGVESGQFVDYEENL